NALTGTQKICFRANIDGGSGSGVMNLDKFRFVKATTASPTPTPSPSPSPSKTPIASPSPQPSTSPVPISGGRAFPGADGFGKNARGAYALYEKTKKAADLPRVIKVTNLNN